MSLRLLHYSDLENAYDDPERIGRLAGLIDSLRDDTTLVAGTGDNTGPGVLALTEDGKQSLDFFEDVEPAVKYLGVKPRGFAVLSVSPRNGRADAGEFNSPRPPACAVGWN